MFVSKLFLSAVAARHVFDLNVVALVYLIPGYPNVLEQHGVGEQAWQVQVWQAGLPKPNFPFPNISYKVTFNQECLFPAFNTF